MISWLFLLANLTLMRAQMQKWLYLPFSRAITSWFTSNWMPHPRAPIIYWRHTWTSLMDILNTTGGLSIRMRRPWILCTMKHLEIFMRWYEHPLRKKILGSINWLYWFINPRIRAYKRYRSCCCHTPTHRIRICPSGRTAIVADSSRVRLGQSSTGSG